MTTGGFVTRATFVTDDEALAREAQTVLGDFSAWFLAQASKRKALGVSEVRTDHADPKALEAEVHELSDRHEARRLAADTRAGSSPDATGHAG